jgi:tight adherence protein B
MKVVVLQVGAGLLVGALLLPLSPAVALLGLLAASAAPRFYLRRIARQRRARFENQLPDTLQLLSMSVRGGFSLLQALQMLASEADEPSRSEFSRLVQEIALGSSLESAIRGLYRRVPTEDVDLLVTAVILQIQSGGNLSHLLDVIAQTMRERRLVEQEIRAMTAQQRVSGILLSLLPPGLVLVLFALAPGYIGPLFTVGWVLVVPIGTAIWTLLGFYLMMRMSKVDF